jgi:hypothetical protein
MTAVDLVHGPLHLMILKTLTWGPMHGYAVARWIRDTTDDVLQIEKDPCTRRFTGWSSAGGSKRTGA